MNHFVKSAAQCSLILGLSLSLTGILNAQVGITSAYTTVVTNPAGTTYFDTYASGAQTSATGTNMKNYYYGNLSGNTVPAARQIQSFQTTNNTLTYNINPVLGLNVYIRRQNPPQTGLLNVDLLYYEGTINGATSELRSNYPYFPRMEDNFLHRFIGMGTDNLFANQSGSVNHNVIERVDVIAQAGYTLENAAATGFAIFERGGAAVHDACVVGIVTAVNASGTPTAYAPTFIQVNSSNYNTAANIYGGDTSDYFVVRRDVNTSNNLLVSNIVVNQGIGGVYLSLASFGLVNNTTIYGYSFFPIDFWNATTPANRAANALDWNNATYFSKTTSEANGGIDLSMVAGIVKSMSISGIIRHDANGLNDLDVNGNPINNPNNEPLYTYLVNPLTNTIIDKVAVAANGTFTFDRTTFGNLNVILSTDGTGIAGNAWNNTLQKLPNGWAYAGEDFGLNNAAGTGINNGTGTGNNAPATLKDGIISVQLTDLSITNVELGIQQTPTAQSKTYFVSNNAFSVGTPTGGFPLVPNFQYVPMSSNALVENTNSSNGSLSGTDPEDCPTGTCNGNTGGVSSSFTIGTINSNTRLYYNHPVNGMIQITNNTTIPNFDIARMMIYGQTGQGASGQSIGFTYALTDKAGSTSAFVSYNITTATPLPLTLISFTASAQNTATILNWKTIREEDVSHFDILRSIDGRTWNHIGKLAAFNEPGLEHNYNFTDYSPVNGVNLYQLGIVDLDGTKAFSNVISIDHQLASSLINIYPNPAATVVTVMLDRVEQEEVVEVVLISAQGKTIRRDSYKGQNEIQLDIRSLAAGIYFVQIKTNKSVVTQKLIKE